MTLSCIPYHETQTLPKLIEAVMDENPALASFYQAPATLDNLVVQMASKGETFSVQTRTILADCLTAQYRHLNPGELTSSQIEALKNPNTFTITTGHQLNLMGGPMYFLYKIISVINLSKILNDRHPNHKFVPVFWMASEDHDFDEVNHFHFGEHCLEWQRQSQGPVGRLSTTELNKLFDQFSAHLERDEHSKALIEMFQNSYLNQHNLADATRALVHQLFGKDGLIVIDGDDLKLKRLFKPTMIQELKEQIIFGKVTTTNQALKRVNPNFKIQVNPRSLNLFYITNDIRERIEINGGSYRVLNTDLSWNLEGILKELEDHPERFSPNVLMRPLYQETVLPNLCYVGGGGELSYWLQLKSCFETFKLNFPLLLHRNSAVVLSKKQQQNLRKSNLSLQDLFLSPEDLTTRIVKTQSNLIDFSKEKQYLKQQFENLYHIAKQTDASFLGAVAAQEKKQIKGLADLEKRLLKAEKRKHKTQIEAALSLQSELFPNVDLQERVINFSFFYNLYGESFIHKLKSELDPFNKGFAVISL